VTIKILEPTFLLNFPNHVFPADRPEFALHALGDITADSGSDRRVVSFDDMAIQVLGQKE